MQREILLRIGHIETTPYEGGNIIIIYVAVVLRKCALISHHINGGAFSSNSQSEQFIG